MLTCTPGWARAIACPGGGGYDPTDMAQLLQPKQQLAGYEIGELVGKGGMGEVYRARQISMDRVVALKILAPRLAKQDPIFAKRFVDEARAAGRLNHPNIIAVHDVGKAPMPGSAAGTEPDLDYFSMEYVDGESVKDVIERQGISPLSLVAQVMQGMTEALVYAEAQGIVHRDIKPDNIMITNGGVVKLADLGLALQLGGEEVVGEKDSQGRNKVMDTPLYMSPEQARALPVDSRSDQYSLGATLFHMLSGKPLFKGDNAKVIMRSHVFDPVPDPKTINPEVPEAWRQLAMRLLAKTPEERFPNAIAMRAAVQAAISGHGSPGISRRVRTNGFANAKERAASMPPWAKYLVYGFAAAVVLMVVGFSIPWGGSHKDPKPPENPVNTQPDPQVVAQKQVERVKSAISALPVDHQKALAALDQLAEDKSIPLGPARDLIEREKAQRTAALAEQKRKEDERLLAEKAKERQARTIELEQAWASNDLVKTKEIIDYLTPEADKLTPSARERLATIKSKFGVALVDQQKAFTDQLVQAHTADEIKNILAKVAGSALAGDTKDAIKDMAGKRLAELAPAQPAQPVDDRVLWQAFNTQLDELRGGLTYGEIARLADKEAAAFPTPEARALVQGIGALGRLAAKAEGALRVYIADANPVVEIVFNNKPAKAKLFKIEDKVSFTLQDGAGDAEMKHDRKSLVLPLRSLMEKALEDSPVVAVDRPAMIGAMLWVWRMPDAAAVFATIPDNPLSKSVAELDRKTRVLDLRAKVQRSGDQATVTYDGGKNPWFASDFLGEGATATPQGLTWATNVIVSAKSKEVELPSLRWKQALRPPFAMNVQFMLAPKTHLLLFGVTSGERTVRIGFNTNRAQHSAVALVTKADGVGFELPRNISWSGLFKLDQPQKVEIRVDADYRVTLRHNENELTSMLQLPTGGTISPLVQAVQLEDGLVTSTTMTALTVSGTLVAPSAE
ncbi:MAG TPA: serine/threonine-protein kinase [Planctomycetota bacterium]|nr:serine/threonine-protein kinase [Planctomycetota bacterium]